MGVTERLARASSRHPWRTILAWVGAIVLALVLAATLLPGNLTTNGHVTGNPQSKQAENLFQQRFPPDKNAVDELIVVRSAAQTVNDPAFTSFLTRLRAEATATGVVYRYSALGVSRDRHAMLIGVQRQADVDKLLSLVERDNGQEGFSVVMTGGGTLDHDFNTLSQHDLKSGELEFGLPAALIILILVFGAVVAGLVPLLMAIVAIVVALGLCAPIAAAFSLSVFFVNMLTGMGLALGIDYSLFVVSRYREERAAGREELAAIAAAGATSSRAVLVSGSVFVIALTGMLLVPSNVMKSLAVGAISVGIVSVLAALTLLPALLGRLGDHVNSLRVPFIGRNIGSGDEGRFWGGVVRAVMRHPVVYLVTFGALLIALAIPTLGLNLGASGVSTLPNRLESKKGYEALNRDFPQASASPALIAVKGDVRSPQVRAAIARLRHELGTDPVFGRSDVRFSADGQLAAIGVEVGGDKTGPRALAAIRHLRSTLIPQTFRGTNTRGGRGRRHRRQRRLHRRDEPLAAVRLRLRARPELCPPDDRLPLHRHRGDVDRPQPALRRCRLRARDPRLPPWDRERPVRFPAGERDRGLGAAVPVLGPVRPVDGLPGLPAEPHQGALRRYWLDHRRSHPHRRLDRAADHGAALIIVAVFSGFARGDLVMFQQMGFGVAVALLIDATIIRSVLLPAAMRLLDGWNWYLPHWLEWLPRIEVEPHREEHVPVPSPGS